MYKVRGKGRIENFNGKPIVPALPFEYEYDAFGASDKITSEAEFEAAIAEVKAANKFPSNEDLLLFVNNKQKANARQKANDAALTAAGIEKPTLENDPQLQLKTIFKALMAGGKHTEQSARELAATMSGVAWAE